MATTITYANQQGSTSEGAFASGKAVSDGAADFNILCGFIPTRIVLLNATNLIEIDWYAGMTAGHYHKTIGTGQDVGLQSVETSGGPVAYTGDDGYGFTVPKSLADTEGDEVYWRAYR